MALIVTQRFIGPRLRSAAKFRGDCGRSNPVPPQWPPSFGRRPQSRLCTLGHKRRSFAIHYVASRHGGGAGEGDADGVEDRSLPDTFNVTRDFTVATFVVLDRTVLLLFHRKLQMWLPPGGHIEQHELPDAAALREVEEETGVRARLLPERAGVVAGPQRLARPEGVQLEQIGPDHQHIDLIYFAVPLAETAIRLNPREGTGGGWYAVDALAAMGVTAEVRQWASLAVLQVAKRLRES